MPKESGDPLSFLRIDNLSVDFRTAESSVHAVKNVSLTLEREETLAVVGESGSGKSTLAHAILQLLPTPPAVYRSGTIHFEGMDLLGASPHHIGGIRGAKIGMVFQEPMVSLNPLHTVYRQMTEGLEHHAPHLDQNDRKDRIFELIDLVGFPELKERLHAYPHQFSGGQRQRIMMIIALSCGPSILIADEPTTALDVTIQEELLTRLKALQKKTRMSLLLITHHLGIVGRLADRILVMKHGQIVEQEKKTHLLQKPQHLYTKTLLESEPSGHPDPLREKPLPLLKVKNIQVTFPTVGKSLFRREKKTVADEVSFHIHQGETLGIVGESGSGKTTLAFAILRLLKAQGQVLFDQEDLMQLSLRKFRPFRRYFQLVFQDPFSSLNPRLSIEQLIGEGIDANAFVGNKIERTQRIIYVLEKVGLKAEDRFRYPHEFSGGQRQRIAIARVLALEPKLIILDEPTSALDLLIQKEILTLLKSIQYETKCAYLFISHDLKVVRSMSHRILVMKEGHVVEQGMTEDIFTHPQHPYTQQLLRSSLAFDLNTTLNEIRTP